MRLSITLFSGAFLLPILIGTSAIASSSKPTVDLLHQSGVSFEGTSEFNPEAYKKLAALRKIFEPKTPTRTKPFRGGVAAKGRGNIAGARRMTNARRLALGLSPNPPVVRDGRYRRQEPSPVPDPLIIENRRAELEDESGNPLGYISSTPSVSGQFETTTDSSSAVEFVVTYTSSGTSQLRIETSGASEMPILALIGGRDNTDNNIGPGSWHYLYVGAAESPGTVAFSPPVVSPNSFTENTGIEAAIETDVWTLDPVTGTLSATWVNEDGTPVPAYLYMQNGALVVLGDPVAFQAQYPDPITPFTWKMVL